MIPKIIEKKNAINLRRNGVTYSEILKEVKVAKSTLSLWLREVQLSKPQQQAITEKRLAAALRGAHAKREKRIKLMEEIYRKAEGEVGTISKRELWLIGIVLYWAEGSKEKSYRPGSSVNFTNSDSLMIKIFITWLVELCGVKIDEIVFEIYIHKNSAERINQVKKFWSEETKLPLRFFNRVYFKKQNQKSVRKNIGNMYNGNLRIRVKSSSTLLRKITGWTMGIYKNYCGIV